MIKLSHLFQESYQSPEWINTKNNLKNSIDTVISKGGPDKDVLLLMKDLLDDIKICTSINDYIDEVNDGYE
jgi:hypothetical protein